LQYLLLKVAEILKLKASKNELKAFPKGKTSPYKPLKNEIEHTKHFNDHNDTPQPKTPHQEIMFCIESTNDIVSNIFEILTTRRMACFDKKCSHRMETE